MKIAQPSIQKLIETLEQTTVTAVAPLQPDGNPVPVHYHLTEVARIQKDFIDCGGTVRSERHAQLQLLVEQDYDHRLAAEKFLRILKSSASILGDDELSLVVEVGEEIAIAYPVASMEVKEDKLLLHLETPMTGCLAPDRCGLPAESDRSKFLKIGADACAPNSGCC